MLFKQAKANINHVLSRTECNTGKIHRWMHSTLKTELITNTHYEQCCLYWPQLDSCSVYPSFNICWNPFSISLKKYGCSLLGNLLALVLKPIDSEKLVLAAEVLVQFMLFCFSDSILIFANKGSRPALLQNWSAMVLDSFHLFTASCVH